MRILYINQSFGVGIGGGTHANELLGGLLSCPGVQVERFPDARGGGLGEACGGFMGILRRLFRRLPIPILFFYGLWLKPLGRQWIPIKERIEGGNFDVLLIRPDLLLRLMDPFTGLAGESTHVCVEVNALIHEETTTRIFWRRHWLRREVKLIDLADSIMVVSDYLKGRLVHHGIDPEKVMVNPNGVNLERFGRGQPSERQETRASWSIPENAFVFGYAGGMESFRRLPEVVSQVAGHLSDDPSAWFVLVGDGQDRAAVGRCVGSFPSSVRSRVQVIGRVPYEKMPGVLSAFDCGLFLYSNPYGSPQKIFEYMAMGLPVIGPDVPAVREVFKDPEHLLMANQDGSDVADLLGRVRSDPKGVKGMADCGKTLVAGEFTWRRNAERLHMFLQTRR